jgi:hypothetical protein
MLYYGPDCTAMQYQMTPDLTPSPKRLARAGPVADVRTQHVVDAGTTSEPSGTTCGTSGTTSKTSGTTCGTEVQCVVLPASMLWHVSH